MLHDDLVMYEVVSLLGFYFRSNNMLYDLVDHPCDMAVGYKRVKLRTDVLVDLRPVRNRRSLNCLIIMFDLVLMIPGRQ